VFTEERSKLERQWDSANRASAEGVRLILRRCRSFLEHVLSV
jgi:hypothetical protein